MSVMVVCAVALFVVKNVLMSLVSVDVLHFFSIFDGEAVAVGVAFCVCCGSWYEVVSVLAGLRGVIECILGC